MAIDISNGWAEAETDRPDGARPLWLSINTGHLRTGIDATSTTNNRVSVIAGDIRGSNNKRMLRCGVNGDCTESAKIGHRRRIGFTELALPQRRTYGPARNCQKG